MTRFDEQIAVTADLVRIPSTRYHEAPAQDFMARLYRDQQLSVDRWQIRLDDIRHLPGYSPTQQEYVDAWNVVGAWRPTTARGRSVILNGHIDVVPEGPLDMWHRPPFAPEVREDGYGRGAGALKRDWCSTNTRCFAHPRLSSRRRVIYSLSSKKNVRNVRLRVAAGYRADAALIRAEFPPADGTQVGVMWFSGESDRTPCPVSGRCGPERHRVSIPVDSLLRLETIWNARKSDDAYFAITCIRPTQCRQDPWWRLGEFSASHNCRSTCVPACCRCRCNKRGAKWNCIRKAAAIPISAIHRRRALGRHQAEPFVLTGHEEVRAVSAHRTVFEAALDEDRPAADNRFFGLYAGLALVYGRDEGHPWLRRMC
jgi:acetylornithine deacetylase